MKYIVTALAISMLPLSAAAQTAPTVSPLCRALMAEYEGGSKQLSYYAFGYSSRSAPQATQLATEKANTLALMQLNLALMAGSRCPLPTRPASEGDYALPALECATAGLQGAEAERDLKCDRSKWTPRATKAP